MYDVAVSLVFLWDAYLGAGVSLTLGLLLGLFSPGWVVALSSCGVRAFALSCAFCFAVFGCCLLVPCTFLKKDKSWSGSRTGEGWEEWRERKQLVGCILYERRICFN